MRAKTFTSANNFIAPESISNFGIPVTNQHETKSLGLEEFNFCPILQNYTYHNNHVAFIPCFSMNRGNIFIEELKLFYLQAPNLTIHYATLFGVSQIQENQIPNIRLDLIENGFHNHVHNSIVFQNNYGLLFNPAIQIWENCFNSNVIFADGSDVRFILNTFYQEIQFHQNNVVNWGNLKHARPLYND